MPRTEQARHQPNETQKQHQPATSDSVEQEQQFISEITSNPALKNNQLDPRNLSPRAILQLQRTIGNQAVMRLMAEAQRGDRGNAKEPAEGDSTPDISTTDAQAVQRLIGFEIETGIPAKKKLKNGTIKDPSYTDFNVDLPGGAKLDVDSNPSGGGKILEFASEPVDETQDTAEFRKTAAGWLGLLTGLRDKAAATPPLRKLKTDIPAAPNRARYGVETGKPDAMDRVSIQATHGLKLDQVRDFLKNATLQNTSGASRVASKEQAAHEAAPSVDPVMAELKKDHNTIQDVTDKHVEEVAGFFALMANYMLSGKYVASGYNKNRSFLFYKSKLNDVRNKLVAENPYAAVALANPDTLHKAMIVLLIVTKRKADEMLWIGTAKPNIMEWMVKILNGTNDVAFESAKNPWGTDIKPGKVEGSIAAVVEHRDIDKMVPQDGALKMSEPGAIVDYLAKVFDANKQWEKLKKKDEGEGGEGG